MVLEGPCFILQQKFLEQFGINRLSDMPKLKEVSELIEADPSLGEQITVFEKEFGNNDDIKKK